MKRSSPASGEWSARVAMLKLNEPGVKSLESEGDRKGGGGGASGGGVRSSASADEPLDDGPSYDKKKL